jgi:hypothetical protein
MVSYIQSKFRDAWQSLIFRPIYMAFQYKDSLSNDRSDSADCGSDCLLRPGPPATHVRHVSESLLQIPPGILREEVCVPARSTEGEQIVLACQRFGRGVANSSSSIDQTT